MKEFAAGIIIRDRKILLLKRSEKEDSPGKWNPPNETIEDGETPEQAVVRGVKEETGLKFTISKLAFNHTYDGKTTHVFLGDAEGDINLDEEEASEYKWLSFDEALELEFAYGYEDVIMRLKEEGY